MDLKELFQLMEKFEKSGLSELTFKKAEDEVTLKKSLPQTALQSMAPAGALHHVGEHLPQGEIIRSPLVGTFYRAPSPDAPPFVEKGDTVKQGQTLCVLEAMKLMNEFQAEFDAIVVNVLAENGKMVEFGAPLFEVRRV